MCFLYNSSAMVWVKNGWGFNTVIIAYFKGYYFYRFAFYLLLLYLFLDLTFAISRLNQLLFCK